MIKWKRCTEMPVSWFRPQVVVGDHKVYVGGGVTEDQNMFTILEYDPYNDVWIIHSPSRVVLYGLSYFQGKLITIGGSNIDGFVGNVSSYNRLNKNWEDKIPPMPTGRCTLTVICTDEAIVACGGAVLDGNLNPVPCQSVEVYISDTSQWHTSACLPHPYAATSFTVIGDHCFLVGEAAESGGGRRVICAKMMDLTEHKIAAASSSSSSPQVWKELSASPLVGSAAVTFNGALLTLGGDDSDGDTVNHVYAFMPKTSSWVRLHHGALPEARGGSSAVQLPDGRVVIVGGNGPDSDKTASVFIGTVHCLLQ